MSSTSKYGILVGVAGGDESAVLRWASDEARRRHLAVTLVHALGGAMPPPPPSVLLTYQPVMEVAHALTVEAAEEYETRHAGAAPDATIVQPGRPGPVLVELSADADLVVVGHRDLGPVRRVVTSSTAASVAAHAHCPAVIVPQRWGESEDYAFNPWVAVGVHEHQAPPQVLQAAFEAAGLHGWGVRLIHAWRADTVYDDIIMGRIDPQWSQRVEEEMREAAKPFLAASEVSSFDVLAVHDWPADALTLIARESALLVVGRRSHRGPLPDRLGSIARTVLRTSGCPVMVVPI
jgi:nucleotide-binding universal stress UspA family protein